MSSFASDQSQIARALEAAYGDPTQDEEPADRGFHAVLRVFLAEQRGIHDGVALDQLDKAGWSLDPSALAGADPRELTDALGEGRSAVPAGLVASLQRLAGWVVGHGGIDGLSEIATATLRDELRAIRGIGPSTADRLLLEGLGRPAFPVGRADYRIMIRHGWVDPSADYDEARETIEQAAPPEATALRRLSSWFHQLAKPCRVASPRCERCPLQPFLPEGGPLDPV